MRSPLLILLILTFALKSHSQVLNPAVDSVPMRDTTMLAADVYVPDDTTQQYPTILIMTPYDRQLYRISGVPLFGHGVDSMHYVVVIVDWRCFYGSVNACVPTPNNGEDGSDIIDWIVQQPWSDGKVGTWGLSALGKVQFQTMKEHNPHHICAVPMVAGPQFNYDEYFPGGAARTEFIEQLDALGFGLGPILYANAVHNVLWQYVEPLDFYPDQIQIPILYIGGWYDHNIKVMMQMWDGLMQQSPAASEDKLLFGPWTHKGMGLTNQGELSYPGAAGWSDSMAIAFFDYHLRSISNGWQNTPKVNYFQLGDDQWMNSNVWPPTGMTTDKLYLNQGTLYPLSVDVSGPSGDTLTYDPADPSPTVGGPTLRIDLDEGPYNQAPVVEARNDVLVFTSPVLLSDAVVKGKIQVNLYISSNRLDTDFSIRLTDVYPDGSSMLVQDGIQRMRFRDGYSAADTSVMTPDSIYYISIELPDDAITFKAGHRIRLDITSSNYPRFDNNLNNGGQMYVAGDTLVATNTVYVDGINPSNITFPVLQPINVSVGEIKLTPDKLNVYPDPVDEILTATIQSDKSFSAEVKVLNIQGQVVQSFSKKMIHSGSNQLHFNVSKLPTGSYILQLKSDNYSQQKMFIKN